MKILGHAFIATHAVDGNNQLLIIGSLIPETLPYIPNEIFDYNELHEGGRKLFEYLNRSYPEKRDLALGLMSHGYKTGADKFSPSSEELVALKRKFLLEKIARAQGLKLSIAQTGLHNYVGLGLDWLLVQNEPKLVKEVQKSLKKVDLEEISGLLAQGFHKNEIEVRVMLKALFRDIYHWDDLNSLEGLAGIWARQASGLPEKDKVNVFKAAEIIKECSKLLEDKWRGFLELVSLKVRKNIETFLKEEA